MRSFLIARRCSSQYARHRRAQQCPQLWAAAQELDRRVAPPVWPRGRVAVCVAGPQGWKRRWVSLEGASLLYSKEEQVGSLCRAKHGCVRARFCGRIRRNQLSHARTSFGWLEPRCHCLLPRRCLCRAQSPIKNDVQIYDASIAEANRNNQEHGFVVRATQLCRGWACPPSQPFV